MLRLGRFHQLSWLLTASNPIEKNDLAHIDDFINSTMEIIY